MKTVQRVLRIPFVKKIICLSVMLIVILLCIFMLSTLATAKRARAAQIESRTSYESVRIVSGDSLWSIAQEYCGGRNTAAFVEDLKLLNGLSSDRIQAGYYILVPVMPQ